MIKIPARDVNVVDSFKVVSKDDGLGVVVVKAAKYSPSKENVKVSIQYYSRYFYTKNNFFVSYLLGQPGMSFDAILTVACQ